MLTINEAISRFLAAKRAGNRRTSTIKLYSTQLAHFLVFAQAHGAWRPEDIQPEHVSAFLSHQLDHGFQDTSVFTQRVVVLSFLKWLTRIGVLAYRPWSELVETIRIDEKDPRYLTIDECEKLFLACRHIIIYREKFVQVRNVAMLAMMIDTGLREAELLNLRICDVRQEGREARVRADSKARKERTVWYSQRTARLLKAYVQLHPEGKPMAFFWTSRRGGRLSAHQVYEIVTRAAHFAGLQDVSPHTLRHTAATLMFNGNMRETEVQRILGHRSSRSTKRYLHIADTELRRRYNECCPMDKISLS